MTINKVCHQCTETGRNDISFGTRWNEDRRSCTKSPSLATRLHGLSLRRVGLYVLLSDQRDLDTCTALRWQLGEGDKGNK